MGPFDGAVSKETAKKCTRKYNIGARRTIALSIESSLPCYFTLFYFAICKIVQRYITIDSIFCSI